MKVVCDDNKLAESQLTVGKIYEVLHENKPTGLYDLVNDKGIQSWYLMKRFSKVKDEGKKKMTIVLNEVAKEDVEKDKYDFTSFPVVLNVAKSTEVKGAEKASIIFNLGIVWADLLEEEDDHRIHQFRKGKDIDQAMSWDSTRQGHEFWSKIQDKLLGY